MIKKKYWSLAYTKYRIKAKQRIYDKLCEDAQIARDNPNPKSATELNESFIEEIFGSAEEEKEK
jgi:hypothetical protein